MLKKDGGSKKRGLGRGLGALFEDEEGVYPQVDPAGHTPGAVRRMAGVDQLEPGPWQPRQYMDPFALKELADSITQHGVLQPLLVRAKPGHDDRFQIIAGERRWRASQKAQLHEVPVVVKELTDEAAMEIALIENLQRADLNAIEEAQGYQRLMSEFGHTQEKLATGVGKSRSHVANMVRLLTLPEDVQDFVRDGRLSAGHARALITAKDPRALAAYVVGHNLSVRDTEKMAAAEAGRANKAPGKGKAGSAEPKDVDTVALEKEMTDLLGLKVVIDVKSDGKGGRWGALKVEFKNLDQLDDVLQRLSHQPGRNILAG
ncbi:MAG: ParB/RepB/Spo0J family partition protein [Alphaproteobacteria bacterium]|nr:ParB/RepB/Spo0J family partition protein [Alphaproteobacteria bacterium]MBU0859305.1 ParB/RepB/Spo0J family partition protein [Alphaproteobacteria bacterium]